MLRYLALALLVGCSTSAGGASFDGPADGGSAGAVTEPAAAGAPIGGGSAGVSVGGSSAGSPMAKGGREPEPPEPGAGAASGGETGEPVGGAPVDAGGSSATGGQAPSAGASGSSATAGAPAGGTGGDTCPADYYCHELGPDAFAKCVVEEQPDDPQFPGCTITRGTCFYPKDAPESCIKPECWKMKRTCD